jgi:flagellar biogenesis protein FliO
MLRTLSCLVAALVVVSAAPVMAVAADADAAGADAADAGADAEVAGADAADAGADAEVAGADAEVAGADAETVGADADAENVHAVTDHDKAGDSGGFLSYDEAEPHARRSFGSLMLRLVISMAIILGLIYGGFLLIKLLARTAKAAPKSEKLIRVVERAALDPKRAIYLVKVVDRLLVVGVGTNEVRTLAEISDETVVESVQDTEFSGHLQSLLGRLAGRQTGARS